jgi:hypothetical protein
MINLPFNKPYVYLIIFLLCSNVISAQIAQKLGDNIGNLDPNAVLEIESTTKGFLLSRMTKAQRDLIATPPEGLMLWCTNCSTAETPEIQIYTSNSWRGLLTTNLDLDLASTTILLGNDDGKATARKISGDISLNNIGVSTIGESKVLSSMILNGDIIDEDVSSSAAILGTKINPTFGNQKVSTTGSLDAGVTTVRTLTSLGTLGVIGATTLSDANINGTLQVKGDAADFTQIPTAPTADPGTNTTQLATTAFVVAQQSESYNSIDAFEKISTTSTSDIIVPGMSKSSIPGKYLLFFNSQYGMTPEYNEVTTDTQELATAVKALSTELLSRARTKTYTGAITFTNANSPIKPGVHFFPAALAINGNVSLDAEGDANAEFIFQVSGALNTAAETHLKLTGGALASNVYFAVEAAAGLGANTNFPGTIVAKDAVSAGAGCEITGRLLSKGGAIASGPGSFSVPTIVSDLPTVDPGLLNNFILFTAAGAVANTGASIYNGDIGTNAGAITGFAGIEVNGTIFQPGVTTVGKNRNGTATFSLYNDDVLVPNSSRTRTTLNNTEDISLQATTTVPNGANANISVRWSIDAGEVSVKNRVLTVIKVQ